METKKCIETRTSIRKFTSEKISVEEIKELIRLAALSPSWKNAQTTRYTAIVNPAVIADIRDHMVPSFNGKILSTAPAVIALSCIKGRSGYEKDGTPTTPYGEAYTYMDCGIAAETLCLAATDMGLGSVIIGIFDVEKIKNTLDIPEDQDLLALIAVGKPDMEIIHRPRKELDEILKIL